jgi:DNA-binding FadR family transcriptional regulator
MGIKKSDTTSLATSLADKIRVRIIEENLQEGDLFMIEADLAQEYGVSRNIAREAVSRLRAWGLLKSRQRKGLVIACPDPAKLLAHSLPAVGQNEAGLEELKKLRYVLEIGAIDLAVANATEEQIDRLEKLGREFESVVRSGGSDEHENEIELAFHSLILEMTGCKLILQMQQVLGRFFQLLNDQSPSQRTARTNEQTIWQHLELAQAIRERDLDRARTMMRLQYKDLICG